MRVFLAIAVVCALTGCGGAPAASPGFPSAAEGWTLDKTVELPVDSEPEPARKLGLKRARKAFYQGPTPLTVTLYEMNSDSASLEMIQTWRAIPDTFVIRRDRNFVIVESAGAPRDRLQAFMSAFDKRLTQ